MKVLNRFGGRGRLTLACGLTATLLVATASPAFAVAEPGTDVLAGEDALSEVSIDVNPTDPDNLVIAGHDDQLATMNTFFTTDGGATWTTVLLDDADDGFDSNFRFDPSVAFDDDGNVYVAYGVRHGSPTVTTLVVATSTDGGASYSQFAAVATDVNVRSLPGNDKWHLATGPDPGVVDRQNVYLAWTRNIEDEPFRTDQRIVVSSSTDAGATFSAPLTINDASIAGVSGGNLFADPGVGPNGELYVLWHNIASGQILFDSSTDGGVTWGTDIVIATSDTGFKTTIPAQPDRGISVGPVLDVDRTGAFGGRIYVTYTDLGTGGLPDVDVLVITSADGGSTWSAPVRVNDDVGSSSQFLPWIDVDQTTGMVGAVWYDTRNDPDNQLSEAFASVSHDGGATWEANTLVADSPSDMSFTNLDRYQGNFLEYIGVAAYDCVLVPVWADNSEDGGDLDYYVDRVVIGGGLCNAAPVADAGGPYTTAEGTDAALDATGSSDPDGDLLIYEWDFDGDGVHDDATGPNPSFTTVGQDGVFTVEVKVTDPKGLSDTDTTTVTVDNVAPAITTLSVTSPVDEGAATTLSGTATDPGWLDDLTVTIDWLDGAGPTSIAVDVENDRPDATLTFSAEHVYGDNGAFAPEVCVSDDDTTVCQDAPAAGVDNVAPTVEIDESTTVELAGIPTVVAAMGEPVEFRSRSTDPGSDDLVVSWDWDDGDPAPDVATDYLVNPPADDGFPSPSVQPRDVVDVQSHQFTAACFHEVGVSTLDDDGGTGDDSVSVIVTGDAGDIRSAGYWYQQFRQGPSQRLDEATLACHLAIVGHASAVFNEVVDATTFDLAESVLMANAKGEDEQLDRQLLAAWLNFASGAIGLDTPVDTDGDGIADASYLDVLTSAESARLDPAASRADKLAQVDVLNRLNKGL